MQSLIVHGGAGKLKSNDDHAVHTEGIKDALKAGLSALKSGGSAVDAAEQAVMSMEDNPVFNCGYGSVLDFHGKVEMDAALMTSNLDAGGLVNGSGMAHPVSVARRIMEETDHVLLGEPGLSEFLDISGIPRNANLAAPNRIEEWNELKKKIQDGTYDAFPRNRQFYVKAENGEYYSTVGAVARDESGLLAAATSTGGIRMKMFGRIGDSSMFGCGTYADAAGAASATGLGEQIIKLTMCRMAVLYMETMDAQAAVDKVLETARERKYECGIIALDNRGNLGYGFTTEIMSYGYIDASGATAAF